MTYSIKASGAGIAALAIIGMSIGAASAASPYGNWKRPKNGAIIKAYKCGGGLGMRVVSSPNKKSVGKRLMCGARKSGANTWKGTLTSSEDGKKYSGTVKLTGGKLKLTGCALGIFCKTEYWKRQ